MEVNGHAGLAKKGSDILCAAVSVLLDSLVAGITVIAAMPVSYTANDGNFLLEMPAESGQSEGVQTLIATTLYSLNTLAKEYPDRLKISMESSKG